MLKIDVIFQIDGTLQQPMKEEFLEIARKRLGDEAMNITFKDVWKYKSNVVRGIRSSL